jgi:hypothetical protein
MKRVFISAAAILAFTAAGYADELSDIQAQQKQLREQMNKRLADLEKRQKALEAQKATVPTINPVDAMAADLPYKAAAKAKPPADDGICIKGICVYGNIDMGLSYIQHGNALNAYGTSPGNSVVSKNSAGAYFGAGPNQLSSTFIGLRGKQEIADNLYAVPTASARSPKITDWPTTCCCRTHSATPRRTDRCSTAPPTSV